MSLVCNILEKMIGVSKPQKKVMAILMETMFAMSGRVNFANLARYSSLHEKTYSRNFNKPFDYVQCSTLAIKEVIDVQKLHAIAFDQVFIPKSVKKTYGDDFFWSGTAGRPQKGLEATGFALIDVASKISYPICVVQTPPHSEIAELINASEVTRMDFYVHQMKETVIQVKKVFEFLKYLVADAANANIKVVTAAQEIGMHLICKLRSDANLKSAEFKKIKGRRRPRKSGIKIDVTKDDGFTLIGEVVLNNHEKSSKKPQKIAKLHAMICYNVNLKQNIKVVRLRHKKNIILLFSTDLELSPEMIVEIYRARFQIEFNFRDAKQFTGFTECQARSKQKINHHLNASFLALLFARIEAVQGCQNGDIKKSFSMENHKRLNHNEMLLNRILLMLGFDPSLFYSHPRRKEIVEYGIIAN